MRTCGIVACAIAFVFMTCAVSMAEANQPGEIAGEGMAERSMFSAGVRFSEPDVLAPATAYLFTFSVTNNSTTTNQWIYDIELYMPSMGYLVDTTTLVAPAPLHQFMGSWEVDYYESAQGKEVQWTYVSTWRSFFGDIRESETLNLSFQATTDDQPTDGFPWYIASDSGTHAMGVAYIGSVTDDASDDSADDAQDDTVASDDDADDVVIDDDFGDDSTDDDANTADKADDDDNAGSGCGC
jgi:hypothetical protein